MKYKILVVGGGGREHAIIKKLKESSQAGEIICAPGNGGISCDANCFPVAADDISGMLALAKSEKADIVFVAPDDPLAAGMVDALEAENIRAFGPSASAARLESSKIFSKILMRKYNIPTAGYETFDNPEKAVGYIRARDKYPVVIKADGLALGKGVVIAEDFDSAEAAVYSMMLDKVFGESGANIVIEEFLTGPEVSVLSFCDGKTILPMVSSMDHKRALDGDKGLNTGGMGTIAPNPYYTSETARRCMEEIFIPTVSALNSENAPFKGCIFFGLMLTPEGPRVIEYNARFGDPETQVVLPLLKTDFIDIINAVIDEKLDEIELEFEEKSAACVVIASGGYPESYEKGKLISGLDSKGQCDGAAIFHAGTRLDGDFYTNGGRVLGVSAVGDTLAEALDKSYNTVQKITFDGAFYRRDIGKK